LTIAGRVRVDQVDVAVPGPVGDGLHLASHPQRLARREFAEEGPIDSGVELRDRENLIGLIEEGVGAPRRSDVGTAAHGF
jgi:hypothetical protein